MYNWNQKSKSGLYYEYTFFILIKSLKIVNKSWKDFVICSSIKVIIVDSKTIFMIMNLKWCAKQEWLYVSAVILHVTCSNDRKVLSST